MTLLRVRLLPGFLLVLLSCGRQDPPASPAAAAPPAPVAPKPPEIQAAARRDPPADWDVRRAGMGPKHSIANAGDEAILEFVRTHAGEPVESAWLKNPSFTERGLAALQQLEGLFSLTLSSPGPHEPLGHDEAGRFRFAPALTDAMVAELCKCRSLRGILVWYGSITEPQKAALRASLPDLRISDNVNKL